MHLHTPSFTKSAKKRRASIASASAARDHVAPPAESKKTKMKKMKKGKSAKQKSKDTSSTKLETPPPSSSPRSVSTDQPAPSPPPHDPTPDNPSTATDEAPTRPRRSARLRNSMGSIAETWHRARPYVERINGTIMPLEYQGVDGRGRKDGGG